MAMRIYAIKLIMFNYVVFSFIMFTSSFLDKNSPMNRHAVNEHDWVFVAIFLSNGSNRLSMQKAHENQRGVNCNYTAHCMYSALIFIG